MPVQSPTKASSSALAEPSRYLAESNHYPKNVLAGRPQAKSQNCAKSLHKRRETRSDQRRSSPVLVSKEDGVSRLESSGEGGVSRPECFYLSGHARSPLSSPVGPRAQRQVFVFCVGPEVLIEEARSVHALTAEEDATTRDHTSFVD